MSIDLACFTDIEAVAADAAGALDRARQPRIFDRLDWFRLLLRHCPPPGSPLIVRARRGDSAAWLFLTVEGREASALANWYTLDFGPVLTGGDAAALIPTIFDYLRHKFGYLLIGLEPLTEERAALLTTSPGWITRPSRASVNWSIGTRAMDWESYWQARPGPLRTTVARRQRNVETRVFTRFDADAWDAYERIYRQSWKPEEGSPAFLRALAGQESEAGTLRLGLALIDGAPVAAQFWLVENGIATIHKLAHIESVRAHSPGTVLSAAMFRHAIEQDRVHRIDFGTGDEPYKADWTDSARPLIRLRLWNATRFSGLVGAARDTASALARRFRAS